MNFITDVWSSIKSSSGFLLVTILTFIYFSFYTIKGERGFFRYMHLTEEVSQARVLSEKYAAERQEWENKVKLLSSESLDLDMLDERAREVLNFVGPKEFVILDEVVKDE